MKIPLFIVNYNRLFYVQNMLADLESVSLIRPVILDNASTYPPLLEWYKQADVEVKRLPENYGPRALWDHKLHLPTTGAFFAVTDPDLDLSQLPQDWPNVLCSGLELYSDIRKVGVSLRLDDLPDKGCGPAARQYELQYWKTRRDYMFWEAGIATTLAVYRVGQPMPTYGPALRADAPYSARHLPWYSDPRVLSDEERYYLSTLEHQKTLKWSPWLKKVASCQTQS